MDARAMLTRAIEGKRAVAMRYQGLDRRCCPHILGRNPDGVPHVLVFQYGGESASGLPPEGSWRCMRLDQIEAVALIDDPWRTAPTEGHPPPKCVTQVELEVA